MNLKQDMLFQLHRNFDWFVITDSRLQYHTIDLWKWFLSDRFGMPLLDQNAIERWSRRTALTDSGITQPSPLCNPQVCGKGWQLRWITVRHTAVVKAPIPLPSTDDFICPLLWFYCITFENSRSNMIRMIRTESGMDSLLKIRLLFHCTRNCYIRSGQVHFKIVLEY